MHLTNADIVANLSTPEARREREGVYFYINGFLMAGFPELPLPNGKVVPAETAEEMDIARALSRSSCARPAPST